MAQTSLSLQKISFCSNYFLKRGINQNLLNQFALDPLSIRGFSTPSPVLPSIKCQKIGGHYRGYIACMLQFFDSYKGVFDKKGIVIIFAFATALIGYDYFYILKKYQYMNYLFGVTGFLGFFCIYIVSQAIEKRTDRYSSLILWGKQSMQIYCLHPFIIAALRFLFSKYMKVGYLYPISFVLAFLTIIICHLLIKKMNTENKFYKIVFGLR